jgi:hypothetical protein
LPTDGWRVRTKPERRAHRASPGSNRQTGGRVIIVADAARAALKEFADLKILAAQVLLQRVGEQLR